MPAARGARTAAALLISAVPLGCLPRVEALADTGTAELGEPPNGAGGADAHPPGPADLGRLEWGDPQCHACVAESCAEEARACGDVPECRPYYECLAQCSVSDIECRSTCFRFAEALTEQEKSLRRCLVDRCAPTCADELTYFDRRGGACGACVEQRCGAEATACFADEACVDQLDCEQQQLADRSFDVEDYLQQCAEGGPYTASGWRALLELDQRLPGVDLDECTYQWCRQSCYGRDWKCLGAYGWSFTGGRTADVTVRVLIDGVGAGQSRGDPAPGAVVTPCTAAGCDAALTRMVDEQGRVTFSGLQTQQTGFEGFFRVEGPLVGARFRPSDVHFSYPLTQGEHAAFVLGADVLTLAESQGHVQQPDKGIVLATVEDCHPASAVGVQVTIWPEEGTTRLYMNGPYPGDGDRTTTGSVLFLNVDPGSVSLSAVYDEPDQNVSAVPLTVSEVEGVEVRAGRVTSVTMTPTPAG